MPRPNARVKPGDVCSVAGWGKTSINATKASARLREAQLIIQEDEECKKLWYTYSKTTQICAGDPKKVQAPYEVGINHLRTKMQGERDLGEDKV